MSNKLETIEASDLVQVAAKKMRDKKISSLVVIDSSNKPVGIITERDFVTKVCADGSDGEKDEGARYYVRCACDYGCHIGC